MEVKKSEKADLEGKKSLFLEIGLCVSLLIMIGAFAWGQGKREVREIPQEIEEFVQTEEIENTVQDQPVPQVPTAANVMTVIAENIQIVDNNTKVETQQIFVDWADDTGFSDAASAVEVDFELPQVFTKVEVDASFQGGGIDAFSRWVRDRVVYPDMARSMNVKGTVMAQFIVNHDGTVSDIKIVSPPQRLLDNEVLRVVKMAPNAWTAPRQAGKAVRQLIEIPVVFQ
jgi:protein TonB